YLKEKKFFILTVGIFLLNIFGIILLRSSDYNLENDFLNSFYYLPAYVFAAFWIGLGLLSAFQLIEKKASRKILLWCLNLIIIFPALLFKINFTNNNLSKFE